MGSIVYLLLSADKIDEMGLDFFLVQFIRRLMPAHVFFHISQIFGKIGMVVQLLITLS